ncbi:type IV pilus biogenesis protein PilM [Sporosarcina sp. Te-1]|uniref:type IV pilus biogenesis protein PilM n=1 Tax=Sporosarcina sp. Te-1 TaxID=2818390 RepID=UPI001A9CBED7|nr:pilus assembly protein PilM [Sporosarcina sp. Te-1]QTD41577.1 pilus assembly protein PilM [Sporosarcina sp. Te-1]
MSMFSRRPRTASLTIEEDAVRYVRLKSMDPLVVEAAEEVLLPPNTIVDGKIVDTETLTVILEGVLKEWGIAKRDVRFLAPDTYVLIRKVAYPDDVELDELKGHFFIEIGSTIYLPFDDPVFDVVPYTPAVQGHEAILIASKESILTGYEDVLKAVKLDPIACDISPLALYRLAHRLFAYDGTEHVMLADLHAGQLTVSIFHEHYPLFMRPVDLEQAADLTISGLEASVSPHVTPMSIVMELEKLMNFYRYNMLNGAASITHLLVNGDFARMEELLALARERFSVKAQVLAGEPLRLPDGQALAPAFNRTVGLALKEVT